MSTRVLCVHDDPNLLAALKRNLRKRFDIDIAEGGEAALAMMDREGTLRGHRGGHADAGNERDRTPDPGAVRGCRHHPDHADR
jgi:hypothetical protein